MLPGLQLSSLLCCQGCSCLVFCVVRDAVVVELLAFKLLLWVGVMFVQGLVMQYVKTTVLDIRMCNTREELPSNNSLRHLHMSRQPCLGAI